MNIAGTEYDINYKALSIFISGCDGTCPGCHNQELWNFSIGNKWYDFDFHQILNCMIKNIWIMGGEPLLQDKKQLQYFLYNLNQYICGRKPVILWTRFQEEDIPNNIKQYINYAKIGEYQCNSESYVEPLFGITLASTNQKIIKIN